MVHVDVSKIRGKMAEHGLTITSLSNMLGIDRNTLTNYFENPGKMPYRILADMAGILCSTKDEAAAIFLAKDLRKTKEQEMCEEDTKGD